MQHEPHTYFKFNRAQISPRAPANSVSNSAARRERRSQRRGAKIALMTQFEYTG